MMLCDVGNTNATFYKDGNITHMKIADFYSYIPKQKIYYINVNENAKKKLQEENFFIDLEPHFKLKSKYLFMGIDRIAACYGIKSGVVVDAGSAITIDVMQDFEHMGGFIMAGISSQLNTCAKISSRLDIAFNSQINLDKLPLCTKDAISYGIVAQIVFTIKKVAKDMPIYFTGGDGEFLSKFFDKSIFDKMLIFRSMIKIIQEKGL